MRLLASTSVAARVAGLVVGLVCIEAAARTFVWWERTTWEPGIGYVLAPGTWLWGREGWALSHWEPHGVRRAPPWSEDAIPVLVAGDSYTEAVQVSDEETFPHRLDVLLSPGGSEHAGARDVRAIAVGRAGASLPDYIVWAARWDELFAPAVVVVELADEDFLYDGRQKKVRGVLPFRRTWASACGRWWYRTIPAR